MVAARASEPMAQVRAGLMEQVRRALRLWGGARTVNDALVPETPEYAGSRTGDLASIPAGTKLPAGPIRVAVGQAFGPHRGFGAEHLADNARRDAGRMPPQQTGDLAEDLMRQTVAVLRGVRQAHEHEGKFILVNPVAQQAIVMTHRDAQGRALSAHPAATTGYYSVTSVRPYKGDPKPPLIVSSLSPTCLRPRPARNCSQLWPSVIAPTRPPPTFLSSAFTVFGTILS